MQTTEAKEHPILFSGAMVQEILGGRKTQTRRIVAPSNSEWGGHSNSFWEHANLRSESVLIDGLRTDHYLHVPCHCQPGGFYPGQHVDCTFCEERGWSDTRDRLYCKWVRGDRLWVRERWAAHQVYDKVPPRDIPEGEHIRYPSDARLGRWRPSIHMPRWASRITLEIKAVRVEQLQEISASDVAAEGFPFSSDLDQFKLLWDGLNKSRGYGWEDNPWVWVVEFETVTC